MCNKGLLLIEDETVWSQTSGEFCENLTHRITDRDKNIISKCNSIFVNQKYFLADIVTFIMFAASLFSQKISNLIMKLDLFNKEKISDFWQDIIIHIVIFVIVFVAYILVRRRLNSKVITNMSYTNIIENNKKRNQNYFVPAEDFADELMGKFAGVKWEETKIRRKQKKRKK